MPIRRNWYRDLPAENHRSAAYHARIMSEMYYMVKLNGILPPACKPLTDAEMVAMGTAVVAGESPESFAARVLDGRQVAA